MNDRKFQACYDIIGVLEDMQTARYDLDKKFTATAYDGNCYKISAVVYDESNKETDLDGALFLEVSTDYLGPTLMDVDGFNPDVVRSVADRIPTKFFIRITMHTEQNASECEHVLREIEVNSDTIIEDWLDENLPGFSDWRQEGNSLVCYSDDGTENYLIAELIHIHK